MSRRLLWKLLPAVAVILMAGTAFAGGVIVSLDSDVPVAQPGQPLTINFSIRSAHDGSMQPGFEPTLYATNTATGETVTASAEALAEPGRYAATLTLPTAGEWEWSIEPDPKWGARFDMTPIQVESASASAAGAAPAAAPGRLASLPAMAWAVLALVAAAAAVALALVRGRRVEAVKG